MVCSSGLGSTVLSFGVAFTMNDTANRPRPLPRVVVTHDDECVLVLLATVHKRGWESIHIQNPFPLDM